MNIPIYALTIDPIGGSRRVHCHQEFLKRGLDFTFINGLTGDNLEVDKIYSKTKNLLFSKRSLTKSEIACYLGFRKIWKIFLDSGEDVCLIVEDDFKIVNELAFKKILNSSNDHNSWDILKLFDFKPKKILNEESWNGVSIVDYKYPASGCVAYLITRKAAKNLLKRKKIFRAVDEDFSNCWEMGIRVRSINPNPIIEISHEVGGSNLEKERSNKKKQTNAGRRIWGILLQMRKQIFAFFYRKAFANF